MKKKNFTAVQKKIRHPSIFYSIMELRSTIEIPLSFIVKEINVLDLLIDLPICDKHPVLVLPGFTTGDWFTKMLRDFLNERNLAVYGWGLGNNWGYNYQFAKKLEKKFLSIHKKHKQKISLLGHSLGGAWAWYLAKKYPELTRNAISFGSPKKNIFLGTIPLLPWLYKRISKQDPKKVSEKLSEIMSTPPPVPSTSIFSKSDGIISCLSCVTENSENSENIMLGDRFLDWRLKRIDKFLGWITSPSHIGLPFHPIIWAIIVDRLAQKEDAWMPLNRKLWQKTMIREIAVTEEELYEQLTFR